MQRRMIAALVSTLAVAAAIAIPLVIVPPAVREMQKLRTELEDAQREQPAKPAIVFSERDPRELFVAREHWDKIGMQVVPISGEVPRRTVKLDGILYLDPEDYVAVRSRFDGEFVDMASVPDLNLPGHAVERSIRFGDEVKKGQVLGSIWSRELGEKKSELAQYVSSLKYDRESVTRLTEADNAVAASRLRDAERRMRDNEISVERVAKTLRSWQLTEEEIQEILDEANRGQADISGDALSRNRIDNWARVEIRSPIDGTIIEKNVTVGAMVNQNDTLYKVANLAHLDVRAFAYEEDLPSIQRLPKDHRSWTIQLKSDPSIQPIHGVFDRIGEVIDPVQHTGLVIGWVDNSNRMLHAGQFVTASIELPDDKPLVAVPTGAMIDFDGKSYLLVSLPDAPEKFHCVEVQVARTDSGNACLCPDTGDKAVPKLTHDMQVITSGAIEIFSEYQQHRATGSPGAGGAAGQSDGGSDNQASKP